MAPAPSKCSVPDTGSVVVPSSLPLDASYEILLRVPARDLCRFRAVSRAWRSLLSDPPFIAAHGARHPADQLIVAGEPAPGNDGGVHLHIMDLCGRIVKRVHVAGDDGDGIQLISSQDGLVCMLGDKGKRCRLLDPATGAVSALPEGLAEEHAAHEVDIEKYSASVVCGKVAGTGEYKVLRVLRTRLSRCAGLCEVLTLGGGGRARWRGKEASPDPHVVHGVKSRAVVNGTVHFLRYIAGRACIFASFDLGTEEWSRTLRGPEVASRFVGKNHFSLAAINGCLALAHYVDPFMDLWFLMDSERGLWVKQHSIKMEGSVWYTNYGFMCPLFVINDGRVVAYGQTKGFLRRYDLNDDTHTNVAEISPDHVGFDLYNGNLLSLLLPNSGSQ